MWHFKGTRINKPNIPKVPRVNKIENYVAGTSVELKKTDDEQTKVNSNAPKENKKNSNLIYLDINVAHDRFAHLNENDLRKVMKQHGINLTGKLLPCEACLLWKSKRQMIPKFTTLKATKIGERIYMDTTGPFPPTLKGSKYWNKICDQFSTMSWNNFMKHKSEVANVVDQFLIMCKGNNKPVKYLRCDNAGEHQEELRNICRRHGVTLEYTAPYTPQQNGIVERRFATDKARAHAMLEAAQLNDTTKKILWAEAAQTSTILGNLVPLENGKTPYEIYYGEPSKLTPKWMVELLKYKFNCVAYVYS
jgi:hypothetical protein